MLRALILTSLVLLSGLSGCLSDDEEIVVEPPIIDDGFRAFSVIAPIDTGINPYHNHFQTNETLPQWLIDDMLTTLVCELTTNGSYSERLSADMETCWNLITTDDVVYFTGTRIFASSSGDTGQLILDDPSDGHGTAVTGAVLDADPDAIIYFVEGFSDEAVLLAGTHPMVDVITTSFGAPGSVPVPGIEDATKVAVVDHHKIHTGAADNSPSPAIQDATAGPPWSIGVSGYAEGEDDQKETMSGSYPDMASDWTQVLPNHQDVDGYHETSGTSFATPRTAGFLGHVMTTLRAEFNDSGSGGRDGALVDGDVQITNSDIRHALNLSGWYPSGTGWDPTTGTIPISPVAPCTQVGWGVLNWSNIDGMIAHLNGSSTLSDRPGDVVLCMELNQQSRETYWGVYPSIDSPANDHSIGMAIVERD